MLLALAVSGYVGNVVTSTSGLLWNGASMFLSMLLSVLFIVAVTVLVAVLAARKARAITPVNALRQGLGTHTFKKNVAPLETSRFPLNVGISVKNFALNLKTNIVVFVLMILFSALGVVAGTLYHNFVTDISAFKTMVGFEPAGVMLMASDT